MDEKRKRSLERAATLAEPGLYFLKQKEKIPFGLRDSSRKKYEVIKNILLSLLGGTEENWNDWQWQLHNRIESLSLLEQLIPLTGEEKKNIEQISKTYRWAMTPYYAALMDPDVPKGDVIKAMSIPCLDELSDSGVDDPSGEEYTNPAGCITRRYPDRLILNLTNACPAFCRHCQRRRRIKQSDAASQENQIQASIEYIRENPEIRDVLLTGGDALMLSDDRLEEIVSKIRAIPHVEIIRLGTRTPVTLPQRITPELVNRLKKHHPIFLNTQFNHPIEITPEAAEACKRLRDNGFVLGNQMVLLKGVNDNKYLVRFLNQELLRIGVRPYYMFHAKQVKGTLHFQTPVRTGTEILRYLQGNTSGLVIPNYIVSAPEGLGKIPLPPNYVVEETEDALTLQTWEGREITVSKDEI